MDTNTQKALESLRRRKVNASIAIAADLANDNLNSICRLALAWISDGNVHGISYFIKPREGPVQAHNLTEDMLADSKPFDVVWMKTLPFSSKTPSSLPTARNGSSQPSRPATKHQDGNCP